MLFHRIVIGLLILAGFALRLHYLTTSYPFFDEYTTVLAARQILSLGWPQLPSGLFYEHGLPATYLIAPFTALFINAPIEQWQPAHWGLMPARWPSLLLSTATIPLIAAVAQRTAVGTPYRAHATAAGLVAAGLFAISPEGVVWGARARMYALATLLVLLTVYLAYRGSAHPAPARYRWLAQAALLAALLTQLGVLLLVPPLVIAMLTVGWLSRRQIGKLANTQIRKYANTQNVKRPGKSTIQQSNQPTNQPTNNPTNQPLWFLQKPVIAQIITLLGIIGLAVWVKRLGQPLGATALSAASNGNLLTELVNTVAYQTTLHFTWPDTEQFLARQFGVEHHLWLATAAVAALVVNIALFIAARHKNTDHNSQAPAPQHRAAAIRHPQFTIHQSLPRSIGHSPFSFLSSNFLFSNFQIFLWLTFGLIVVEMVTLLEPFRRNPRYIVMFLPLFYLIAASAIIYLLWLIFYATRQFLRLPGNLPALVIHPIGSLLVVITAAFIGYSDLRVALDTPEPAYPQAFARVLEQWQPGDALLTMNTPAAELYLGRVDGFTVQGDAVAAQFLLNKETTPVDRWLGAPWVGNAADFRAALDAAPRTWFVSDTIRQPVYFRGDWQAVLNTQMEQVWVGDNALLYRTRANRSPLSTTPAVNLEATFGDSIRLLGYTLESPKPNTPDTELQLTLFWQPLTEIVVDYTIFLHLRNSEGINIAQRDSRPLNGTYPTSRWQPGETIIDPITLPLFDGLPPGAYTLVAGLYRLDTLERLPVANDTSGENAVLLGEVVLP